MLILAEPCGVFNPKLRLQGCSQLVRIAPRRVGVVERSEGLDNLHAGSLRAFTAFGFLKLNGITFLKLAAIHLVDVDEQIFAAVIGLDETETFLVEEPSYFSCWHNLILLSRLAGDARRVPE